MDRILARTGATRTPTSDGLEINFICEFFAFSTEFRSNFPCFVLRRRHRFLYFLAQNCASECLGRPRSHPRPPFGGMFWAVRPKWASWEVSGAILDASGRPWDIPGTSLRYFFEARGRHFHEKASRKAHFRRFLMIVCCRRRFS